MVADSHAFGMLTGYNKLIDGTFCRRYTREYARHRAIWAKKPMFSFNPIALRVSCEDVLAILQSAFL
jgi:hypothetical protein